MGRPTGYTSNYTTTGGLDISGALYCASGCVLGASGGSVGVGTTTPNYYNNAGSATFNIYNTSQNNTSLYISGNPNQNNQLFFVPYLGTAGYNILSVSGDVGIFMGNGGAPPSSGSGMVIGPASTTAAGIKILANGMVGFGTSNPGYPVEMYTPPSGSNRTTLGSGGIYYGSSSGTGTSYNGGTGVTLALTGGYGVGYAAAWIAQSDKRIKTNIVDVDDISALETLRLIQPKRYNYIDNVARGNQPVWGFIAQQVGEVLPYSTTLTSDYIPNIYELATVSSDGFTITLANKSTTDISMNFSPLLMRFYDANNNTIEKEIDQIIDEKSFTVKNAFDTTDLCGNQIFVYGQKVDDFHALDKNSIFTIATAALQEVDRDLQTNIATVQELQTTIQTQQQQIQELQTQLASVLSRLSAAGIA